MVIVWGMNGDGTYASNRSVNGAYDHPRMHKLFTAKKRLVDYSNHKSMAMKLDPLEINFESLCLEFDAILVFFREAKVH